jgi:hypothetical protein
LLLANRLLSITSGGVPQKRTARVLRGHTREELGLRFLAKLAFFRFSPIDCYQ